MNKCKKHPNYKAIRKPTADCKDCQAIYEETQKALGTRTHIDLRPALAKSNRLP